MGDRTTASGEESTAMGYRTTASGVDATAMGNQTTASGRTSTAMGFNTTASGSDATAMGSSTTASGGKSTAMGDDATASGGWSMAAGSEAAAEGNNSFVWNDGSAYHAIPNSSLDGLSSEKAVNGEPVTGPETFSVGAQGGVRFITGSGSVTYIQGGSAGWSTTSTRSAKTASSTAVGSARVTSVFADRVEV